MINNTVHDYTADDFEGKSADVFAMVNHDLTYGQYFIMVEGEDDMPFYTKMLPSGSVYLFPMDGHKWMKNVLDDLNPVFPGTLIAVKDADFDHLDNIAPPYPNYLLTDRHDWEMQTIEPERTHNIAMRYGVDENIAETLHTEIIREIENYSFVRWASRQEEDIDKRLAFKRNTHDFCGKTVSECVVALNSQQEDPQRELDPELAERFKNEHHPADWRQLINGHDYFRLLHNLVHKHKHVPTQMKKGEIQKVFLKDYTVEEFKQTALGSSLTALMT